MAHHARTEKPAFARRRPPAGHEPPPPKDESEVRWLISYSDFMMQLVCLFILLYSVSSTDPSKAGVIAESWRAEMGLEPLKVESNEAEAAAPPVTEADIAPMLRQLEIVAGRSPDGRHLRVHPRSDGFELRFHHGMFDEGAGRPSAEGMKLLDFVAGLLRPLERRVKSIELVGHTAAGDEEREGGSALRLSLTRSREALRWVSRPESPQRLDAARLSAGGRGPHEPVADNSDPAFRAANRRVDLVVRLETAAK